MRSEAMSIKKPVPMVATSHGSVCPVCGKLSYSNYGIHPQCAMLRADAKLRGKAKKRKAR